MPAYRTKSSSRVIVLFPSQVVTADTDGAWFDISDLRSLDIIFHQTDAKAAAGDRLDVLVKTKFGESGDEMTVGHFTQSTGNGADAIILHCQFNQAGDPPTGDTDVTSDPGAGNFINSVMGTHLQIVADVTDGGAHGQSFTLSVVGFGKG